MSFAAGRRLFHPSAHLWLRATKEAAKIASTRHPWMVEIGLSERGLADIGDITSLTAVQVQKERSGWFARAGDKLVVIDWDAHSITSADELYHTVWETFSEQTVVCAPIAGVVDEVNTISPLVEDLDEDTVLVRMRTDAESLSQSSKHMLEHDDYTNLVAKIPPGRFESDS